MKQVKMKTSIRILAILFGLFLSVGAFAQSTITGQVTDASGEPVIGATVRIVGQDGGVITDIDGNFSIKAEPGSMLSVSYIGYKTVEKPVTQNMKITLQDDAQLLEDVVVIGYGTVKKGDLTGSVSAMKPDEMSKGITNSAADMLVGKVAGVDVITSGGAPGAGSQIRIRGGSSLNASNDPLIVIDGLTIDNYNQKDPGYYDRNVLAMINPNDIETFNILKDASATAIYGSRASNGVIIITTKKGKKGSGPKFSYNGDVTVSTTQKRYEVLNGDEYRALVGKVIGESGVALLGNANTDWQDEIYRTAVSTSHNLSMTGGLKNMPYRVSIGYQSDQGIIKNSFMNRFNASVNLAPSFFDNHLNFNITAKYMAEKDRYVDSGAAIGGALSMDPTRPVMDDSEPYKFLGGYWQNIVSANFSDPSWAYTKNPNAPQNPVAYLNQNERYAHSDDFTANFEVDYKIHGFEDLHLHASYGGQYTAYRESNMNSPYGYSNNYYGWDGRTYGWKYSITANAYAQYTHTFGVHYIDVMAGAEESHYHRSGYNIGQGTDPYTGEANNPALRNETEWATHNSLVSYFGRLNYTLLDRYMLTATIRADGSSRFADGHKWGYFPSVALAWKINDEKFMKNIKWWNEFKLRLGWGQTGQQDIGYDFLYAPLYVTSNSYAQYPFGDTYYYTMRPDKYNPDLTWETTTTWNAGLDFAFLNNRITANVDAYYRKTTDLIQEVTLPTLMNFGQRMAQNIGSLENYGVEFTVGAKPIVTKDFVWDVQYNVAWNHNEITELIGGDEDYYVESGSTISRGNSTHVQAHTVGQPANSFWVYQQVYDENGKPLEGVYVDRDGNGIINNDDRYFYKSPAADVFMGLTMKFTYKNWDLSTAFRASLGNYVYYDFLSNRAAVSASGLYSNSAFTNTTQAAVDLGFSGTNGTEYYLSDYFVRNASFLKCTNITLGYSFPALLKYAGQDYFSGRIFATVQNPFIITKYKGLDPEVAGGIDRNPYPRPFSVQIGLNLNF